MRAFLAIEDFPKPKQKHQKSTLRCFSFTHLLISLINKPIVQIKDYCIKNITLHRQLILLTIGIQISNA